MSEAAVQPITIPDPQVLQQEARHRTTQLVSGGIGVAAAVGLAVVTSRAQEGIVPFNLPFSEDVMNALNNVDAVLERAGGVGLVGAIALIGLAKIAAVRNTRADLVDQLSSREMVPDASNRKAGGILSRIGSGKFPVVAFTGAMMASLTSAIGTEVTEGPIRPIKIMEHYLPGGDKAQLVVQDKYAMPMVNSAVSAAHTQAVLRSAAARGVDAAPIAQNLGTIEENGKGRTALTIGVPMPAGSPAYWSSGMDCTSIPVFVDEKSGIKQGQEDVRIQGVRVRVVGTTEGVSAINRVGVIADEEAVTECLNRSDARHGIALDTSAQEARAIVAEAATENSNGPVVIGMHQYKENSKEFWEKNVKPTTNILAMLSGLMAFVSISGDISLRLARSRRELGTLLASGVSPRLIQATETLRSLKDSVVASVTGAAAAVAATPMVGTAVFGMEARVGVKEALVGAGTILLGSLGAVLRKVGSARKTVKTVDPANSTRI